MQRHSARPSICAALIGLVALSACGDSASDLDLADACRIGQRLVDESAAGDDEGIDRQVDRLAELDGLDESDLDVADLDDLARGFDQDSVDDLAAEFDALECSLDAPVAIGPSPSEPAPSTDAPSATDAPVPTAPADTDPSSEATVETEPPTTAPTTTAPTAEPVDDTAPATTPVPPTGVPVDVGSAGPGVATGADLLTEAVLVDFGMEDMPYSPNTNVIEFSLVRADQPSRGGHSYDDSITMTATTDMSIDDVVMAYRTEIESLGIDFEYTSSESSDDRRESASIRAERERTDLDPWRLDVTATSDNEFPGVVIIEVLRTGGRTAPVPDFPPALEPLLIEPARVGADLGWSLSQYTITVIQGFDGSAIDQPSILWDVSADNTVSASATAMQEAFGEPIDGLEADDEMVSWVVGDTLRPEARFRISYFDSFGTQARWTGG